MISEKIYDTNVCNRPVYIARISLVVSALHWVNRWVHKAANVSWYSCRCPGTKQAPGHQQPTWLNSIAWVTDGFPLIPISYKNVRDQWQNDFFVICEFGFSQWQHPMYYKIEFMKMQQHALLCLVRPTCTYYIAMVAYGHSHYTVKLLS